MPQPNPVEVPTNKNTSALGAGRRDNRLGSLTGNYTMLQEMGLHQLREYPPEPREGSAGTSEGHGQKSKCPLIHKVNYEKWYILQKTML